MKPLLLAPCHLLLVALVPALWAAPPPELAIVQQQYEKAVMAPYTAAKAELDTKFIAALTKATSTAKQAGQLDEVLAIQDDQKRLEIREVKIGVDLSNYILPFHFLAERRALAPATGSATPQRG